MALIPETTCPKCRGPITFFDVMGIITPFQCIYCPTCGDMVFLKHRWTFLFFSVILGFTVASASFLALLQGVMMGLKVFMASLGVMVVAELVLTGYVVKKRDLVVRKSR